MVMEWGEKMTTFSLLGELLL